MNPVFTSVGTAVASAAAISVPWGTHTADDIGILVVEISGNNSLTTPSGWNLLGNSTDVASTAGSKLGVYWKRATSSSEANASVADSGNHQVGMIYVFSGCPKSGTPVDVIFADSKTSASTTATAPAVETQYDNDLIVIVVGRPNDSASTSEFNSPTNSNLTSLTARGEAGTTDGNGGGFGLFTGVLATAGDSGTTTITKATSTTDTYVTFALKPAGLSIEIDTTPSTIFTVGTPTVEFTGSDDESANDLEYRIQISDNSIFGTESTVDSFSDTGTSGVYLGPGLTAQGQCFTCSATTRLQNVKMKLICANATLFAGTMFAKIYAMTGTYGTSGKPTGSALAVSNPFDMSQISNAAYAEYTFTFPPDSQITLSSSTYYCAVIETQNGDSTNYWNVQSNSVGSHSGNSCYYSSGTWNALSSTDVQFVVTGIADDILIDSLSVSDSGFLNTVSGGDTHPFTSGDKISYTVQSGDNLSDGSYYMRAATEAPSGSSVYSDWSTTTDFSVALAVNIKTINNLAYANIKTVNGLAVASMKSFNGLT